MKYRQWKKNYKKRYGVNPPASIDKRKKRKAAAREIKALAKADFMESIGRAAETLKGAMANFMRALGNGMDAAGTVCRNVADYMQPLEIKGRVFSWEVREYGNTLYAVHEINALGGADEIRAVTYSKKAAEKIAEILENDHLEHVRLNEPERIQKRQDAADSLRAAAITAYERGAVENG